MMNDVIIKSIKEEDKDLLTEVFFDEKVKKTYMLPDFKNKEESDKLFNRLKELSLNENRFVRGIYYNNQIVGFLNDVEITDEFIELGYAINSKFHNLGIGTKALNLALNELLEKGHKQVITGAFITNKASIRIMEKCGMKKINRVDFIEYRNATHECIYYCKEK